MVVLAAVPDFSAEQLRRIQSAAPVETLQPPYSLIDRDVENEILPYAEREGIGVIVYSPMAYGLLTGRMTHDRIAAARRRLARTRPAIPRAAAVTPPRPRRNRSTEPEVNSDRARRADGVRQLEALGYTVTLTAAA